MMSEKLINPIGANYRHDLEAWVLYHDGSKRIGQIDGYGSRELVKDILDHLLAPAPVDGVEIEEVISRIKDGSFYEDYDWASGPALRALDALQSSTAQSAGIVDGYEAALKDIAMQQLTSEPDEESEARGDDYEFAYDTMIKVARKALKGGS